MWGTRVVDIDHGFLLRFIPTHVGNTSPPCTSGRRTSVHPHACGEHPHRPTRAISGTGSSPRMWGTRGNLVNGHASGRFIPTHVGNTTLGVRVWRHSPVHPHACGEHVRPQKPSKEKTGSSPRMWGTLVAQGSYYGRIRFIPTHVGNTRIPSVTATPLPVHPHAWGEHSLGSRTSTVCRGSSPRMWGTRHIHGIRDVLRRFIPTHVGNTSVI